LRSIRSSSRARTESQRGFVLVIALVLAILYFMLMGLVMIDSSRAQAEAQRFRARMMAAVLAENAAELACAQMVTLPGGTANKEDNQGRMFGTYRRMAGDKFEVNGEGETKGVVRQQATVLLEGHIEGSTVHIDYSRHSQ
jgi:hypothetical protein